MMSELPGAPNGMPDPRGTERTVSNQRARDAMRAWEQRLDQEYRGAPPATNALTPKDTETNHG